MTTLNHRPRADRRVAPRAPFDNRLCLWCAGSGISIVAELRRVGAEVKRVHVLEADQACGVCGGSGLAHPPAEVPA